MRFLSALRRACPISVQQQQQCQQQRVNALWRASPISTARKERGISHEHAVSMPYIRLLPFLQMAETKTSIRQIVCQCPTSGFSHFYQDLTDVQTKANDCVNALHRASPISTVAVCKNCGEKTVSMPYIGLLPFLLLRFLKEEGEKPTCVNALHRASPISTVPFKKPYKINGFRDRFQGVIVRKF